MKCVYVATWAPSLFVALYSGYELRAGLYDSVPLPALDQRTVDYASEPLLWDEAFRSKVRAGLCAAHTRKLRPIEGVLRSSCP